MENDIIKQFNLPAYVKNRSFADASSQIKRRFKGREDIESKATEKDLLDRLRSAQEFVKAQEQAKQQAKETAQAMKQGDAVVDDLGQVINRNDPRVQNGSLQPNEPPQPPDVSQDPNAQAAMQQLDQQVPQEQGLMGQIQNACGGMMKKMALGGDPELDQFGNPIVAQTNTPSAGDIGGAIGGLTSLTSQGMKAFGDTGIDTSGATSTEKVGLGMATGTGALQGAASGAAIGKAIPIPGADLIGAGVGALAGGTMGLIGGMRANEDAQKAQVNNTYMKASKANNIFANGGRLSDDPTNPLFKSTTTIPQVGATGFTQVPSVMDNILGNKTLKNSIPDYTGAGSLNYGATGALPSQIDNRTPVQKSLDKVNTKGINTASIEAPLRKNLMDKIVSGYNKADDNAYWAAQADKAISTPADAESAVDPNKKGFDWKGLGKTAMGSGEALRYAPALMDAYQLATLKKPKAEGTARLDNRYQRQLTDENAIMNAIREETNAAREGIRQTSGGSASEARANLLATQLGSAKALASASAEAREGNLEENRKAQQFNLGIDQANIQQANLQQDINARNIGQYDTQRSKLLASLGTTAGAIGKEELYKKYPEMMGLSYNWRGKYNELSDEEKETIKKSRAEKKIKYSKTGSTKEEDKAE